MLPLRQIFLHGGRRKIESVPTKILMAKRVGGGYSSLVTLVLFLTLTSLMAAGSTLAPWNQWCYCKQMRLLPHLAWYPTCNRGKQSIWEKNYIHTTCKARLNPPCCLLLLPDHQGASCCSPDSPKPLDYIPSYGFLISLADPVKQTGVHSNTTSVPVESHTCLTQ